MFIGDNYFIQYI